MTSVPGQTAETPDIPCASSSSCFRCPPLSLLIPVGQYSGESQVPAIIENTRAKLSKLPQLSLGFSAKKFYVVQSLYNKYLTFYDIVQKWLLYELGKTSLWLCFLQESVSRLSLPLSLRLNAYQEASNFNTFSTF